REIIGIMTAGTIIFVTGVADDAKDLNPKLKFLLQIVAASVACYFGVRIDFLTDPTNTSDVINLSTYISIPISIFWIVGITNTINLIDGLDGLSSGISAISAISFSVIAAENGNVEMTFLSLVLAGACLGFLPYNFNPASIFVGDSGAMFMGFMLACISIQAVIKSTAALSMIIPILGIAIPILDTSFAIIRRFVNGRKIYIADKGHVHHRLLDKGYSQRQTVLILYLISIIYSGIGILLSRTNAVNSLIITIIIFIATVGVAWRTGFFEMKEEEK
ncbi:MAG: undecaprenyl/decaprenyl-phosphate alpha-N-acetylglucosaminyl 1-phosphate transferase, partial [Tissierellia bacterium]|nr:undecaprenyl/decaprenyl-phosphate alpha-N-acetylglucosaminyl 1-phosphate transferase [Tissierellia bacterium]